MRHIILCGVAMFFAVSTAIAGDLVDPPINLGSFESHQDGGHDWSGSYIGISAGIMDVNNTYDIDGLGVLFSNHKSGFNGGVYIGHNWQNGDWVYGLEGEFVFGDVKTENSAPFTVDMESSGFASAKARLGKAFGDFHVYGSIGAAYIFADHKAQFAMAPFTTFSMDDSNLAPVYGGGIEYALKNDFVVRASYQYVGYSVDHATTQIRASVLNEHERLSSMHIASFGIAKRF